MMFVFNSDFMHMVVCSTIKVILKIALKNRNISPCLEKCNILNPNHCAMIHIYIAWLTYF